MVNMAIAKFRWRRWWSAVSLLESWLSDADIEEQKTTGAYLIAALDRDRLSDHLFFPDEMKGKSW
ncbi:MAG: hypothetical protein IM585_22535 [Pseudanabaena sp. M135S2SP2A07QC]|nr:hypothetical protein [Pseudanabaena sp. M125S2SP2A07QC]MCA6534962.1 hypothetical protein [Pseudanabaena sp. M176S2SP2A07QC]MCA6540238.1 hypothetical protein [Pseudanabaena sp. M037S2SP2A07QC]MCA6545402.1 hypothetical protein [Pseudanabaena sp. M074S1SP2A07QC]MCA6549016.1 hypothetical protein [Pseudanabaena sp. M152S2SP2A07QC]MCA6554663.1 hypothetical protein [Pseudanabaena sp. M135S2SP2A07QC]MCA6565179.1 hypothetical protein [Pseudanabaena sp. M151S2SP2A07QC]MCA6570534.1 hypothetical prot